MAQQDWYIILPINTMVSMQLLRILVTPIMTHLLMETGIGMEIMANNGIITTVIIIMVVHIATVILNATIKSNQQIN